MAMYGSGSGQFSGSNSMGEYTGGYSQLTGINPNVAFYGDPYSSFYGAIDPGYWNQFEPTTDEGRGLGVPVRTPVAPQAPQLSPIQQMAQQQAALDMGTWGQPYPTPAMNPMAGFGGGQAPFSFNQFFGGK